MFASGVFGFFAGGGAVVSPLPGGVADHFSETQANAAWRFNADGSVDQREGSYANNVHQWFRPTQTAIGSSYWIRATLVTGTTPNGDAVGSWLALSSAREWSLSAVPNQTRTCQLTIAIASDAAGTNIVASGTYSLSADANLL